MEIDVTAENFTEAVLESSLPVLVDFWAEWCMPCKMIEPVLAELASDLEDQVVIARVNVDTAGDLPGQYDIVSIPALLLFKGGEVVDRHVGAAPKELLLELVKKHLG
ncbi:thioredoxin [Alkalispirochaeta sphaeroplastigenens]|uniref:Thioredoxin n=1 Tax=Alkalispirochaeta sphaeroplastigenens TaxID=1187066 RepID=A0A2S4JX27_9SPIO|nr:thioredoxin [Alkalispirochaeta sphaeroplastigenens]POR04078.1 thioredoxin [Alkalispirochaeta sphaeroplastigenens]